MSEIVEKVELENPVENEFPSDAFEKMKRTMNSLR